MRHHATFGGAVGVSDSTFAVYKTLEISMIAVVEAMTGKLTIARADEVIKGWADALVRRARIDLHTRVEGPIDWSRTYVIMSNHQSHYDIPLLYHVVPATMRMVTKKELFRVPLWGRAMREAGMVEVDRQDRSQAVASLRAAAAAIAQGVNIWIAPEGTRSRTGALGPLRKGGFHLAREAGAPILPVAIRGSREVLPAKTAIVRRGARVEVTFGAAIETAGQDQSALMTHVRSFLERHLER